jgi:hypothetical protein
LRVVDKFNPVFVCAWVVCVLVQFVQVFDDLGAAADVARRV